MIVLVAAAALSLAIDVASKQLVMGAAAEGRVHVVINTRPALSVPHTAALLAVIVGVALTAAPDGLIAVGLGLAIGGAAGNLVDRMHRGGVVDFIAAGPWPVFNLADAAMAAGIFLAAVSVL